MVGDKFLCISRFPSTLYATLYMYYHYQARAHNRGMTRLELPGVDTRGSVGG
jgi:hypothetical protein